MPKQIINNAPGAIPPLPIFSQAVISNGTLYVSGSIGCNAQFVVADGIKAQTKAALDNMKAVVEGAGSNLEHVLKVNIYLTDIAGDFAAFNEVYLTYFTDRGNMPARTCVGVAALPVAGALVEVECVAKLANRD